MVSLRESLKLGFHPGIRHREKGFVWHPTRFLTSVGEARLRAELHAQFEEVHLHEDR